MILPAITERQLATILAALRLWQDGSAIGDEGSPYLEAIASNGGTLKPLSNEEVDRLCERLNIGDAYHDGSPRKSWHELGALEQWSWQG